MSSQTLEGDGIDYSNAGKRAQEANRACRLARAGEAGEAGGCIVAINETARKCKSTGTIQDLHQINEKKNALFFSLCSSLSSFIYTVWKFIVHRIVNWKSD